MANIDWVAFAVVMVFIAIAVVAFFVIRRRSLRKQKTNPELHQSNASNPTPLYHAPVEAQQAYLARQNPAPKVPAKQKLFYEERAQDRLQV